MNLPHLIILLVVVICAAGAFALGKKRHSIGALLATFLLGSEVSLSLLAWKEGPWPLYLSGMEVIFVASLFISYGIYRKLSC